MTVSIKIKSVKQSDRDVIDKLVETFIEEEGTELPNGGGMITEVPSDCDKYSIKRMSRDTDLEVRSL